MSIIRRKRGNVIYVCEVIYVGIKEGKQKLKEKIIGKLDENGNVIPSKKRLAEQAKQESVEAAQKSQETSETSAIAVIETPITTEVVNADVINKEDNKKDTASSETKNLPQVVSKKAEFFKMGMTKIENTVFDPQKNEGIYDATDINDVKINVSRGKSLKKRIDTLLYIDFNDSKANGISISYENRITPYDREIHNAVATLAAAGNECITPGMIFQLLSGNTSDGRNKMGEETRKKILASVDKMRHTSIEIDAVAEVKAGIVTTAKFSSYIIPAERTELEINGQAVKDGIKLLALPPLYEYANLKNQVATVAVKMLDTPLVNTPENIELKSYLLRRILSMANEKNRMNNIIRYDSIYQYMQVKSATPSALKMKHKQIRDKVKRLLDFWKTMNLFSDYKEIKEGRIFAKIEIC